MKKITIKPRRSFRIDETYEGETMETRVAKMLTNKEPIETTSPIIYTEKKKGVEPQYDIRTDRFEIAYAATDHIHKTAIAKREESSQSEDLTSESTHGE